jgi:hypothetical protein
MVAPIPMNIKSIRVRWRSILLVVPFCWWCCCADPCGLLLDAEDDSSPSTPDLDERCTISLVPALLLLRYNGFRRNGRTHWRGTVMMLVNLGEPPRIENSEKLSFTNSCLCCADTFGLVMSHGARARVFLVFSVAVVPGSPVYSKGCGHSQFLIVYCTPVHQYVRTSKMALVDYGNCHQ